MGRIIYLLQVGAHTTGGHKMIVRHVETLRSLGFNAVCACSPADAVPTWFTHDAPFVQPWPLAPDDVVVVPDDAPQVMRNMLQAKARVVVFSQNPYWFAALGFNALDLYPPERFPPILAVSEGLAATIRRAYPQAQVEVVPCFADERVFMPGTKRNLIAVTPRKRRMEAAAIKVFFQKFHPRHADFEWISLFDATEAQVAEGFAEARVFLSLSRLESVGLAPLEAMASGCVCAGFTGVGGAAFATRHNGFWVADEDCEAAADALAEAVDLARDGGAPLDAHLKAGLETAEHWSHARFREALGATWMRLAPTLRV